MVVTWHNKSIDWLAERFPLNHTRFVLYSKGGLRSCYTDIPEALAPAVVGCHETHNAGGREAHSMAEFITSNYDLLPRLTYFTQDDAHMSHATMPLPADMNTAAFQEWAAHAEARPFSTRETCLCSIIVEPIWTLQQYGSRLYVPMRWFMEAFLDIDVAAANWTAVRWPSGANLVVPGAAIRSRPRALYALIQQLFNGTEPALVDNLAPDTALVFQNQVSRQQVGMMPMAHVFERLWFAIFDVRYSPRQADYDAGSPARPLARKARGAQSVKQHGSV